MWKTDVDSIEREREQEFCRSESEAEAGMTDLVLDSLLVESHYVLVLC